MSKKAKIIANQNRQGDVLVEQVVAMPLSASAIPLEADGSVTLAHGEVTGHRHAFYGGAVMFRDDGAGSGVAYVRLDKATPLKHDEHTAPVLPTGDYRVIRQREYSPSEIRQVAD